MGVPLHSPLAGISAGVDLLLSAGRWAAGRRLARPADEAERRRPAIAARAG